MKNFLIFCALCLAFTSASASCKTSCNKKKCCSKVCDPNHKQKAPDLDKAMQKGSQVVVKGGLKSVPNTKFVLEFFNNAESCCDDQGKTLLGRLKVETDSHGEVRFVATLPCACVCGSKCSHITATATRLRGKTLTDTSEFSNSVKVH